MLPGPLLYQIVHEFTFKGCLTTSHSAYRFLSVYQPDSALSKLDEAYSVCLRSASFHFTTIYRVVIAMPKLIVKRQQHFHNDEKQGNCDF